MKRKRYTEEQIISILKEHEAGAAVADLARRHGVAENTGGTGPVVLPVHDAGRATAGFARPQAIGAAGAGGCRLT